MQMDRGVSCAKTVRTNASVDYAERRFTESTNYFFSEVTLLLAPNRVFVPLKCLESLLYLSLGSLGRAFKSQFSYDTKLYVRSNPSPLRGLKIVPREYPRTQRENSACNYRRW